MTTKQTDQQIVVTAFSGARWRRFLPVAAVLTFIIAAGQGHLVAQPPIEDKERGEEEQIERRREWFFSTRRAGTKSEKDLERLRQDGMLATRSALDVQRVRRSMGVEGAQHSWTSMGPTPSTFGGYAFGNVSGRVTSLAADWAGGKLYVGTAAGGLWKSTDDGGSWTSIFDSAGTQTVGTVAIDPNDPNVIWAGTGDNVAFYGCESYFGIGLLRSGDGGLTWEVRNGTGANTLNDLASFANVIVDPRNSNRIVTGGRIRGCSEGSEQNGGLYTSNDGGLTWVPRLADTAIYEIARDPAVPDILWAGTGQGVYKSADNGVTWTLQTNSGLPNGSTGRTELAIAPSDGNTVYALFGGSFWRTTNGGVSWTAMSSGGSACDGQCGYNMVLRVHRTNPNIVYRGTIHIFKSVDGGTTWIDLSNEWGASQKVHQDTHELLTDPDDPNTFYVGSDGGVWKTTDGGDSFINRNGNLNVTQFYAIDVRAADPGVICGGAQDNSSLARTTSNVWDLQSETGDGFVCHIDPQDANYAYVTSYATGGYPQVFRSTTGLLGQFSLITGSGSGVNQTSRINWVTPSVLDPDHPNILYLGTHRVYRSADHGDSWTQVGPADLTGDSGSLLSLEINRNFTDVLYSGSESGKVWRTANNGSDWVDITTGLPARSINDLASDPANSERAFAVVGGFNTPHLWEWTAGAGWVARGTGLPNVPANTVLMLTDTDILVGTDTGIFRSSDGGVTFQPYMDGLPQGLVVTDLKHNPLQSVVTAGTYGRGAWQVGIEVGPMPPVVRYDSRLPLVEVNGDGDGLVERGETWSVRPILKNRGGVSALGVQARLSTSTPGVTILSSGPRPYGDIAPGATSAVASAYTFALDTSQCSTEFAFNILGITSTNAPGAYPDTLEALTVPSVCPLLRYQSFSNLTEIDGNGNGGIDPGETWELTVNLRNDGSEAATGVSASLVPDPASPVSVTLLQVASTYANLAVGAAAPSNQAYRFRVDSSAPCGEWISLGLASRSTNPASTYPTEAGVIRLFVGGTGPWVTVFRDDFESGQGDWATGSPTEWQIDIPRGLGEPMPDPSDGYEGHGPHVLGTDLTGLGAVPGNYENNLIYPNWSWYETPTLFFPPMYKLSVSYARWLNVDFGDRASLFAYTPEKGYRELYASYDAADSAWTMNSFDISNIAEGASSIFFEFFLESGAQGTASGWNIDAFEVRGVPLTSCEPYVPDTTPPSVAITSPTENANVSGTVNVTVNAFDNIAVARVDLYRDGTVIGTDSSSPYSISWNTSNETMGSHTLVAYAYDTSNLSTSSSPVHVNIPCNTVGATDLKVSKAGGGLLTWTAVAGATPFDVVRGGLSTLRSTNGNFQSATGLCIANDTTNTSSTSSLNPSAGEGYWFLVRGSTCGGAGTYDDGTQVASRDAGINAAGNRSCP